MVVLKERTADTLEGMIHGSLIRSLHHRFTSSELWTRWCYHSSTNSSQYVLGSRWRDVLTINTEFTIIFIHGVTRIIYRFHEAYRNLFSLSFRHGLSRGHSARVGHRRADRLPWSGDCGGEPAEGTVVITVEWAIDRGYGRDIDCAHWSLDACRGIANLTNGHAVSLIPEVHWVILVLITSGLGIQKKYIIMLLYYHWNIVDWA